MAKQRALAFLALLSGAFGINYEVIYYRLITSSFGDMLHVHAAILATFLFGIALGARVATRVRPWLWLMEILVGAAAFAVASVLDLVAASSLLPAIGRSPLLTVAGTGALVFLPATLVGISVPLFTDYLYALRSDRGVEAFRSVYALYNLGAVASVLAVEFALVRSLGQHGTLYAVAAGNIAVGLLLRFGFPELRQPAATPEPPAAPAETIDRRTALGLAVLGAASSIFQMLFVTAAFELVGAKREVFALALTLVLIGFPLGTGLARGFTLARATHLCTLATCVSFIAFPGFVASYTLGAESFAAEGGFWCTVPGRAAWQLIFLALLGLVPFTCFGAVLPLVLAGRRGNPAAVSAAMFHSGLGNSAGYLIYVLAVNPVLAERWQLLLVLCALHAGLVLLEGWGAYRGSAGRLALGFAAAAVMAVSLPYPRWFRHHFPDADASAFGTIEVARSGGGSAGIIRDRDPQGRERKLLFYRGTTSIQASLGGIATPEEVLSGVLPVLFAPSRERACVFGIGTGVTAGTTALLFDRTDAVEIDGAIVDLLDCFADANFDLRHNPRASVTHDDARTFLVAAEARYDVIVNSVSVPEFESAAKIYTTEFFRRVKGALKPGGVYFTWVGLSMNDECLPAILGSLKRVFPHCFATLLRPGYFMLALSEAPLRPRDLAGVPLPPGVERSLATLAGEPGRIAEYVNAVHLTDDFYATMTLGAQESTDDLPLAGFVAGDPRIPRTMLADWLDAHPEFARRDFVRGGALASERRAERYSLYASGPLPAIADRALPVTVVELKGYLERLGPSTAARLREEPEARLRMRNRLAEEASRRAPEDAAIREMRIQVGLELGRRDPFDARLHHEIGRLARGLPAYEAAGRASRYRAIVLHPRFRTFAEPAGGDD